MLYFNAAVAQLVEIALRRSEGMLTASGALLVYTGIHTGRSPNDKFLVESLDTKDTVWWENNQKLTEAQFERLHAKMLDYLRGKDLFVFSGYAGANPNYSVPVKVINEYAWQNIFSQHVLIRPQDSARPIPTEPQLTILSAPGFKAKPSIDGTNSESFIIIHLNKQIILIGGTHYAGEIKKSVFTVMNYLLPARGILPLHCSANRNPNGQVSLFFGLSGSGRTSLSVAADHSLIGDDEHGWSHEGIFNIEGGCYAKCIGLNRDNKPQIWNAIKFGTILENVVIDNEARNPNYGSQALTDNTRAAYPINHIRNSIYPGVAGHPKTIIFLTADAFGVLPPIARLTPEQALYYFLSGYTCKLAATGRSVSEPEATFSACFAAPFLPLPPVVYARLLKEKIASHNVQVYLINTGWQGGRYGIGKRIDIHYTRKIVAAATDGKLDKVPYAKDPLFQFQIPLSCPEIPENLLIPDKSWQNTTAYHETAHHLVSLFRANAVKTGIPEKIAAGFGGRW